MFFKSMSSACLHRLTKIAPIKYKNSYCVGWGCEMVGQSEVEREGV